MLATPLLSASPLLSRSPLLFSAFNPSNDCTTYTSTAVTGSLTIFFDPYRRDF